METNTVSSENPKIEERKPVCRYILIATFLFLAVFAYVKFTDRNCARKYENALRFYESNHLIEAEKAFRDISRKEYKDKNDYLTLISIENLPENPDWAGMDFDRYELLDTLAFQSSTPQETEIREKHIRKTREIYEGKKKEEEYYFYKLSHIKKFSPFVGMPDRYIDQTLLGKHMNYNGKVIEKPDGKRVYQETYEYGKQEIRQTKKTYSVLYTVSFSATVENGKVVAVEDFRYAPQTKDISTPAYRPSYNDLHYNVLDYDFAEDFQEDWQDEFEGEDDAESYLEEYGF